MILFTRRNYVVDKRVEAEQAFEELTREIDDALDAIASDIKDVINNVDDMDTDEIKSALQGVIDEIG